MKRTFKIGPFLPAALAAAALCVCLIAASLPAMAETSEEAQPAQTAAAQSPRQILSGRAERPIEISYTSALPASAAVKSAASALPAAEETPAEPEASGALTVKKPHSETQEDDRPADLTPVRETAPDTETAEALSDAEAQTAAETPDDLVLLDTFIATAYCVTGTTSTGTYTTVNRTLAVNPEVIPYGTHVWLYLDDGTFVGDYYAEDTGSNMMENPYVIDIYMGEDSYNECILWGAQHVSVYVEADAS